MAEETACTVAIGDVPAWVDEKYLFQLFLPTQAVVSVRMSRVPSAAGTRTAHMTLRSHDAAAGALRAYNGHAPPGVEGWVLNMGWATEELPENQEHSIFVGDLAPSVRDADLLAAFSAHYAAAYEAHVVTDATTGRPKGFGFVRFSDEAQRDEAIHGLGGVALHGRALRLSVASRRTAPQGGGAGAAGAAPQAFTQDDYSRDNTTLFVGGLAAGATEAELAELFQPFGALAGVRVPPGKNCGFVEFAMREAAEAALSAVHGHVLRGAALRLSWGKNPLRHARGGGGGGYAGAARPSQPYDNAPLLHAADPALSQQAYADGYHVASGTAPPAPAGALPPRTNPFAGDPAAYDVAYRNAMVRSRHVPLVAPLHSAAAPRVLAAGMWQPV